MNKTLCTLAVANTNAMKNHVDFMERVVRAVVYNCQNSKSTENLYLKYCTFNKTANKIHDFQKVKDCHLSGYTKTIIPSGELALIDSCYHLVQGLSTYIRSNNYDLANAILILVTNEYEMVSNLDIVAVKNRFEELHFSSQLESVFAVLVGIDIDYAISGIKLMNFSSNVGFNQYVQFGKLTEEYKSPIINFITDTIISQCLALGSGYIGEYVGV